MGICLANTIFALDLRNGVIKSCNVLSFKIWAGTVAWQNEMCYPLKIKSIIITRKHDKT